MPQRSAISTKVSASAAAHAHGRRVRCVGACGRKSGALGRPRSRPRCAGGLRPPHVARLRADGAA
jgi:hypothetical protein